MLPKELQPLGIVNVGTFCFLFFQPLGPRYRWVMGASQAVSHTEIGFVAVTALDPMTTLHTPHTLTMTTRLTIPTTLNQPRTHAHPPKRGLWMMGM
jgi:hypothetical protein